MRFIAVFVLAILALAEICNGTNGRGDKNENARTNKNLAPSGTKFLSGSSQTMLHKVLSSDGTLAQKRQQLAQELQRMQTDHNKKYGKLPQFSGTPSTQLGMPQNYYAPQQTSNFVATPYLPQSQSTRRTGAYQSSQFQVQQPSASSHYGGPFQQAPMPDTSSFPAFPNPSNQSAPFNSSTNFGPSQNETDSLDWSGGNSQNNAGTLESVIRKPSSSEDLQNHPFNQSGPLNSSTNFGPSQNETDSLDWSEGNSQDNDGSLYSVVRPRKPSSSKGESATKTGKKPRK